MSLGESCSEPKGIFKEDLEYANSDYIFFQNLCHTHNIFCLCFKIFFCKNCDKYLKGKNDLTHKRLFRSQAEIKTDNPIWNSSSSCNECGETFDSKRKPKIPAEVPLKLKKKERNLQVTCLQSGCSTHTDHDWTECDLKNQFSD